MPVGAAAGTAQYSGKFVPEIWSSQMLIKFYETVCMAAISNTKYAGEIKNVGDKVIIRTVPTVTISDYVKNSDIDFEYLESANVELLIDKAKNFGFLSDVIDVHQSDLPIIEKFAQDASEQMKISIETGVFADIYADAATYNQGATAGYIDRDINLGVSGTPLAVTSADVLSLIVESMQCLDDYSVFQMDRWGVGPNWFFTKILLSELKDASLAGDGTSILRNGRQGRIADCTLYKSVLLTSVTDGGGEKAFYPLFGQKEALSFASQMTRVKPIEPSMRHQQGMKGLNVYGYKVLKGEALVAPYIYKAA